MKLTKTSNTLKVMLVILGGLFTSYEASANLPLSVGENHICVKDNSGYLKCGGKNQYGQLGAGSSERLSLTYVGGLSQNSVSQVSASLRNTCAVQNGKLLCWGHNTYGLLGNGSSILNSTGPVQVTGMLSGVTNVSVGEYVICAVQNGGVKCWGVNGYGHFGNGTVSAGSNVPVSVPGLETGVSAVAVGLNHACAIQNSAVKCWGNHVFGQLGIGNVNSVLIYTPTSVIGMESGVSDISIGMHQSCGIKNGSLKCWGHVIIQSGPYVSSTGASSPIQVPGLESGVTKVAVGLRHLCAIQNASLKCWGNNPMGQLGNGTTNGTGLPSQVPGLSSGVTGVAVGGNTTCAVQNVANVSGLKCFGDNVESQIRHVGQVYRALVPTTVGQPFVGSGIKKTSSSQHHSCAIRNDALLCWGRNNKGQLGIGNNIDSHTPVQVIGMANGASDVSTGDDHTCAIHNGNIKCWGSNTRGQLGNGSNIDSSTPVQVSGALNPALSIDAGGEHSCAIISSPVQQLDRYLHCWGKNEFGQLGIINSTVDTTTPTSIGTNVSAVSAGGNHTCVITNSQIRCTGRNHKWQLGFATGNSPYFASFAPVYNLPSGATAVTTGSDHSCGIVNGKVWCWGANNKGQLGNGTNIDSIAVGSSFFYPAEAIGLSSGFTAIVAGNEHTCALRGSVNNKKGLSCWGNNNNGQLGIGNMNSSSTPVLVANSSNVDKIGANCLSKLYTGVVGSPPTFQLFCSGDNYYGQAGQTRLFRFLSPVTVF